MNSRSPAFRITLLLSTIVVSFLLTVVVRFAKGYIESDPIQVSLNSGGAETASHTSNETIQISLQWGGFYACKNEKGYKVFRLLDLTPDTLHSITYGEIFQEIPHLSQVIYLVPEKEHQTQPATDILRMNPVLIGERNLTLEDLIPYSQYLSSKGINGSRLMKFTDRIVRLSYDSPLLTKLAGKNGLLKFEQP